MGKTKWTTEDMPSMVGKIAVVTGANSGLGFYTAKALAEKGATVIMACRNMGKGNEAKTKIETMVPGAKLLLYELDLADLKSVKRFADEFKKSFKQLDLLINNAGLMAIPYYKTADGFEMQFGVNHLGHFALTGHLFSILLNTKESRIINLSSIAHAFGSIRFEDLNWEKEYRKWGAYGMSKLANLLFTDELIRRLNGNTGNITVAAAHPGYADTELQSKGAEMKGSKLGSRLFRLVNRLVAQSGEMGALPTLYAATAKDVTSGEFYGPGGFLKMKGHPALDMPKKGKIDSETAKKLWEESERMTGVKYTF